MHEISSAKAPSWFASAGDDNDVVLSSRVRLSRNLADHAFPGDQQQNASAEEQQVHVADLVTSAVRGELMPDLLDTETLELRPEELLPESRALLSERRIGAGPDGRWPRRLFVSADESVDISIGLIDHIRITARASGDRLERAFERAKELDRRLEEVLAYAVSLDFGYLSTEIRNSGTALRASVLLALPALSESGKIPELSEEMELSGCSLVADDHLNIEGREPQVYCLRNDRTLGMSEEAILSELEERTRALVHYERIAREALVVSGAEVIADASHRALGLLRSARLLTADEALSLLGQLRLGVVTDLVQGVAVDTVNALLFLVGDGHVRVASYDRARRVDHGEENILAVRAGRIRDALAA
jgi:protein arginine kinase